MSELSLALIAREAVGILDRYMRERGAFAAPTGEWVRHQKLVDFLVDSEDLGLSLDDFSSRYLAPAMRVLAAVIPGGCKFVPFGDIDGGQLAVSASGETMLRVRMLKHLMTPMCRIEVLLAPADACSQCGKYPCVCDDEVHQVEMLLGETLGFMFYKDEPIADHVAGSWPDIAGPGAVVSVPIMAETQAETDLRRAMDSLAGNKPMSKAPPPPPPPPKTYPDFLAPLHRRPGNQW